MNQTTTPLKSPQNSIKILPESVKALIMESQKLINEALTSNTLGINKAWLLSPKLGTDFTRPKWTDSIQSATSNQRVQANKSNS